jgi:acyl carrier protein
MRVVHFADKLWQNESRPATLPAETVRMSTRSQILDVFKQVAKEQDKQLGPLSDELPLLDTGLDSLCFAIIVSRLETMLGVDPFSQDDGAPCPMTIGEFVGLYEKAVQ